MVTKDRVALNPSKVIRDAATVVALWPASCLVKLMYYSKEDVDITKGQIPEHITKSKLMAKEYGIGKTHVVT